MIEKPDLALFYPVHTYPTTWLGSSTEVEFKCAEHGHICGFGERTGLTFHEEWPVYELRSRSHPEVNGWLAALSPDGFVLQRRATV